MRRLVVVAVVTLLAGCASAPMTETPPGGEDCDVTVVFGSLGAGIDTFSLHYVQNWLANQDDLVSNITETSWGKEGERTLCVTAQTPNAGDKLFWGAWNKLRESVRKSPITLINRQGKIIQVKPIKPNDRHYDGLVDAPAKDNGPPRNPYEPRAPS